MQNEDEFYIAQLLKHTGGRQVLWSFDFQGQRVVLTTNQLMKQHAFRNAVTEQINYVPPRRAPINHQSWINKLIATCVEDENADLRG